MLLYFETNFEIIYDLYLQKSISVKLDIYLHLPITGSNFRYNTISEEQKIARTVSLNYFYAVISLIDYKNLLTLS